MFPGLRATVASLSYSEYTLPIFINSPFTTSASTLTPSVSLEISNFTLFTCVSTSLCLI